MGQAGAELMVGSGGVEGVAWAVVVSRVVDVPGV